MNVAQGYWFEIVTLKYFAGVNLMSEVMFQELQKVISTISGSWVLEKRYPMINKKQTFMFT